MSLTATKLAYCCFAKALPLLRLATERYGQLLITKVKIYTSILLFVTLLSCNHTYKQVATINYNDSSRVDSIYGRGNWSKYFKEWSSARGVTIKLRLINDSMYHIQWGKLPNLRELNFEFYLDGHVSWLPKYIAESNEYIVIRQSCGNPCWRGFFLPLIDSMPPIVINEYLDFDLTTYLVASIKASNLIEIKNLKTNKTEDHIINGCSSLFIGYCIDSLSIKGKTLKFKWIPETIINSNNGTFKTEKIKI